MAQWLWRRCFNFVIVLSLFRNHFPLDKGGALHLHRLESSSPKDAWKVLEKKLKNMKSLQTMDRQAIRKAHLSFQLMWAKNGLKIVTHSIIPSVDVKNVKNRKFETDEKHIKNTCKNNYSKENYISWRNKINKLGMTEANAHSYIK